MTKAIIADNKPIKAALTKGETYYWCRCGRSQNQPFCDGSHQNTGITPVSFEAKEDGDAYLCRCKQTGNQPYCDGTHKQFSDADVGHPAPDNGSTGDSSSGSDKPEPKATAEEPYVELIHAMSKPGYLKSHPHGEMDAMGVPRNKLPGWDDIQIMTAQLARQPLLEDEPVDTELVIGPQAKKPLVLSMPLFVSDMSFGALSENAKVALARGAELAGTGICSGEGGMLDTEQAENSRYFYELASARFGYQESLLKKVQAFHFKGGQAAKTGTGGHLPAGKNKGKIAEIRNLKPGTDAISPSRFADLQTPEDFKQFGDRVREITGGIPIGFKLSANHIEQDIRFALEASADYIILDGRGGGTGAAPLIFRDHISVPTLAALARARRCLDQEGVSGKVTLIVTGGLRMPMDFVKAMALGADGVALANSAIQAVGCIGARMCHTNQCPSGVATQNPELSKRINIDDSAQRLQRFLTTSVHQMQIMARACGHDRLGQFDINDISTWQKQVAELTGIHFAGDPES